MCQPPPNFFIAQSKLVHNCLHISFSRRGLPHKLECPPMLLAPFQRRYKAYNALLLSRQFINVGHIYPITVLFQKVINHTASHLRRIIRCRRGKQLIDFIKQGNLLYWHDPDNGLSDGAYRVVSAPEEIEDDSIILIATDASEAEVWASELSPISTPISHKKDFMRWKEKQEAEGMEFFDRLSDVIDTDSDLAVGDMVAFTNDYGVVFGPKEVLAFRKPWNGGRCVYTDSDAYWFPDRPEQLTIQSKGGTK